jgi:23S rRNA (cytosine1962-C5)-methyltransferase
MTDINNRAEITLLAHRDKRAQSGYPWIYSNEIQMTPQAKALPAGTLTLFRDPTGRPIAQGFFNPHNLIAGRILSRNVGRAINQDFLAERIDQALAIRCKLGLEHFARIVHAEADRLPGLIIDRHGDAVVIECNAAGMSLLEDALVGAVRQVLSPKTIILRNDSPARGLEGLSDERRIILGTLDGPVEIVENDVTYLADPLNGQKTGWFYDHRANRARIASLSSGARVLDFYSHSGGFALAAAKAGALSVVGIDSSALAIDLANQAAVKNNLTDTVSFIEANVFEEGQRRNDAHEKFDIVIADPPPFARSRKDVENAAKGYRKLARMAAGLVAPGGFMFIASCSYNMAADRFLSEVNRGLGQAGRAARVLEQTGAAMDHPVHPLLPESAYLKGLLLALD